jgi:hypothetical protein
VGIGTASPSALLQVNTASSGANVIKVTGGSSQELNIGVNNGFGGPYIVTSSNHALRFGTNDTEQARITTAGLLQFNSGYGSVATAYGCRAWVNFNGTGTVSIRASGNVSSITDGGTGDYIVNFSNAMPDANYSIVGMTGPQTGVSLNTGMSLSTDVAVPTSSAARVQCRRRDTNSDVDVGYALVSVFR